MRRETSTKPLFGLAPMPLPCTRVSVVVPVRNEAEHLIQTLDALRFQETAPGVPLAKDIYEVLLLVNNCTDNSYSIAHEYCRQHPDFKLHIDVVDLPPAKANIGTVRRLLMDEAFRRLMLTQNNNTIIASTDGDSFVNCRWIHHIIKEIDKGNDAVGGRILTEPGNGPARMHHLRNVTYRCLLTQAEAMLDPMENDPDPDHFQYFGANMAITSLMYEKVGKLPEVPYLEDVALYKALLLHDARIRKSRLVKVYTSSRVNGRVEVGFSEQLKKWMLEDQAKIPQLVESVNPMLWKFYIRKRLRNCWMNYNENQLIDQTELDTIAGCINVKAAWLNKHLITSTYFGTFWHTVEQMIETNEPAVELQPIKEAITKLREFVNDPQFTVFQKDPIYMFSAADAANA
jgi:glycosyltransferase involved in cell wall biosynthesis